MRLKPKECLFGRVGNTLRIKGNVFVTSKFSFSSHFLRYLTVCQRKSCIVVCAKPKEVKFM